MVAYDWVWWLKLPPFFYWGFGILLLARILLHLGMSSIFIFDTTKNLVARNLILFHAKLGSREESDQWLELVFLIFKSRPLPLASFPGVVCQGSPKSWDSWFNIRWAQSPSRHSYEQSIMSELRAKANISLQPCFSDILHPLPLVICFSARCGKCSQVEHYSTLCPKAANWYLVGTAGDYRLQVYLVHTVRCHHEARIGSFWTCCCFALEDGVNGRAV